MTLRNTICAVVPRERAGSRTSDRFAYQVDWALCHLLGLHESGADYLIVFDYLDDVIVLDSSSEPESIRFYQVKSRGRTHWSLSKLLERDQGSGGPLFSIFGKLYHNSLCFPKETAAVTLVSNVPFNINLIENGKVVSGSTRTEIHCRDFQDSVKQKVRAQLREEHALKEDPEFEEITFLQVADLSLQGHRAQATGQLAQFLNRLVPDGAFPTVRIYQVLFDDIRRRNDYDRPVAKFEELVTEKGLSRSEFQSILDNICSLGSAQPTWREIESRLHGEGVDLASLRILKSEWARFQVERADPSNVHHRSIVNVVEKIVDEVLGEKTASSYRELLDEVIGRFRKAYPEQQAYRDEYISVIALAKYHE